MGRRERYSLEKLETTIEQITVVIYEVIKSFAARNQITIRSATEYLITQELIHCLLTSVDSLNVNNNQKGAL